MKKKGYNTGKKKRKGRETRVAGKVTEYLAHSDYGVRLAATVALGRLGKHATASHRTHSTVTSWKAGESR